MKRVNNPDKSKLHEIAWFIQRFGLSSLIKGAARRSLSPLVVKYAKPRKFSFNGENYYMLYSGYNTTWADERGVEVPISKRFTEKAKGKILEVGNVLSHYYNTNWDILDKFEKAPGVVNEDVIDYNPKEKYDFIISVSTFEHFGFEDGTDNKVQTSADKIMQAFSNLKDNCLKKGGSLVITTPLGYNPDMNHLISSGSFNFKEVHFLKRFSGKQWKEVSKQEALSCKYNNPFPHANAIMIGIYKK